MDLRYEEMQELVLTKTLGKIGYQNLITVPKLRAHLDEKNVPSDIIMHSDILYLGKTDIIAPLRSGECKFQFSHQMRRINKNNMYYFSLELKPELKASIKRKYFNPDDRDWHYETLDENDIEGNIKRYCKHSMTTKTIGNTLEVMVDDKIVCRCTEESFKKGSIGIRTDNIKIILYSRFSRYNKMRI